MAMYIAIIQECIGKRNVLFIISPLDGAQLEPKTTIFQYLDK